MTDTERNALLATLKDRFAHNMARHEGVEWGEVRTRLSDRPEMVRVLFDMEATGGEPDVIGRDDRGAFIFCDCSAETPKGRRSLCYDGDALEARKQHKPAGSAMQAAAALGADLLTEEQYRALQGLGEFDTKSSSWVQTPPDVRGRGGALFCDRRYGRVFTYHNGAESYYASRGFRCRLKV